MVTEEWDKPYDGSWLATNKSKGDEIRTSKSYGKSHIRHLVGIALLIIVVDNPSSKKFTARPPKRRHRRLCLQHP